MTVRTYVKSTLLASLVALALGGFLLHLRIHPFTHSPSKLIPFVSGLLSLVLVPLLFSFRKTLSYGYVLNGMLVILGTVAMAHFSISNWPKPVSVGAILLKTTLADIALLWGKFFVGKALFDLELYGYDRDQAKKGITCRYPNYGWWMVHLVVLSLVYYLGHLVWR
jgi:hypothetical protein